ncbi:unnamed protein product [Chrysoparadoxa australica]
MGEMKKLLGRCPDFANEKCKLQNLLEESGHVLLMSPKYHPELAGVGIEYSWGQGKQYFRNHNTQEGGVKELRIKVEKALGPDMLKLDLVRAYARRSRDYRRVYVMIPTVFWESERSSFFI